MSEAATEPALEATPLALAAGATEGAPETDAERDGRRRRRRGGRGRNRGEGAAAAEGGAEGGAEQVPTFEDSQNNEAVEAEPMRAEETRAAEPVVDVPLPQPIEAARPIIVPAPVAAPVAAPVMPAAAPAVRAEPYRLPIEALAAVASGAGLEWVHSNADKVREAQDAIAAAPKPAHVPREPKASVAIDDGPLILVETKKDLSQIRLPFDGA